MNFKPVEPYSLFDLKPARRMSSLEHVPVIQRVRLHKKKKGKKQRRLKKKQIRLLKKQKRKNCSINILKASNAVTSVRQRPPSIKVIESLESTDLSRNQKRKQVVKLLNISSDSSQTRIAAKIIKHCSFIKEKKHIKCPKVRCVLYYNMFTV